MCIFEAKFAVASYQVNICPIAHIPDVTSLSFDQLTKLLPKMLKVGLSVVKAKLQIESDRDERLHYGFNYPPSIPHLHLVIFKLPLKQKEPPDNFMAYPRWIPYDLLINPSPASLTSTTSFASTTSLSSTSSTHHCSDDAHSQSRKALREFFEVTVKSPEYEQEHRSYRSSVLRLHYDLFS
eukprot:TRINITY_DN9287_c0_g1_i2.p1 TRINITY_DN9287_c0_g1~~TRINITY_DN9287_c0_g1_i2.p1  ORF type:complete len:181 (-),score=30.18 TRINITY_DN9287_c0_g1_i2:70-612(-)